MSDLGTNCSSTCATRDHKTWGECQRAKNLRIGFCQSAHGLDYTNAKKNDAELQAYRDARAQGIQPAGTTMPAIRQAVELSNAVGKAYDAGTNSFTDSGV